MNYDMLNREDHIKSLALTVARNRVGPDDPIEEVLAREGIDPTDFSAILTDKTFKLYLKAYVTELQESGFSFATKCRVLAEDAVADIYHMVKDPEAPAAARIKGLENLVQWAGIGAKPTDTSSAAGGFSITFNVPSLGAGAAPVNAQINVVSPEKPVFSTNFEPETLPAPPVSDVIPRHATVKLSIDDPWEDPVFLPKNPTPHADDHDVDAYAP